MMKIIVYHFILFCAVWSLSACGPTVSKSWAPYGDAPAKKHFFSSEENDGDTSRREASMNLTYQGRDLIAQGKPDDAIQILERAMSLYSSNGKACYYLAEAFLFKKNVKQAEEFNRLAGLYIKSESDWLDRLKVQKKKIEFAKLQKVGY